MSGLVPTQHVTPRVLDATPRRSHASSLGHAIRLVLAGLILASVAVVAPAPSLVPAAAAATPDRASPDAAARPSVPKVVIVVGPMGGRTYGYIRSARALASQARSLGAKVFEVYSPYATWDRVRKVSRAADLLIYLGHGNGWPSPYGPFQTDTKDGLGLNPSYGSGNYRVKYYGEAWIARGMDLANRAVVLLHRLCYASGNSEWGWAAPSRWTAHRRVDNYGAGFLRAGARAVFADAIRDPGYVLRGLLRSNKTIREIFWSAPHARRAFASTFASSRTPGKHAILDPLWSGGYYRSVVGDLSMTAQAWRGEGPAR